ncbi:DUF929 domain-containing protein [Sulfurisphaera javensis]|uniref:DUF929 domain-containing protein n=1 Tax=Sulfurisphaera javensis TaxID=2049879 RepID=A0AAT9GNE8_9CREN
MAKRKSKKQESKESKLLYIPFIALFIVLVIFFTLPMIHSSSTSNNNSLSTSSQNSQGPFFQFVKVSNKDYAPNNTVEVYFISWYGCPFGASDSWGLYIALSHFGILNVTPTYSDLEQLPISPQQNPISGKVPGLIFNSFKSNSSVEFYPIYLLGRIYNNNNTASLPNGTIISYSGSSLVNFELNELNKTAPSWVYNLVYQYQIQTPFPGRTQAIAYLGNPPHIVSTIIITGPNGTWMIMGYDQTINYGMPGLLAQYAASNGYSPTLPSQILQYVKNNNVPAQLSFIEAEGQQIYNIIEQEL